MTSNDVYSADPSLHLEYRPFVSILVKLPYLSLGSCPDGLHLWRSRVRLCHGLIPTNISLVSFLHLEAKGLAFEKQRAKTGRFGHSEP